MGAMKHLSRFINQTTTLVIIIIGVVLLSFSLVVYYQRYYLEPETVFWQTIENNLNSSSITRYERGKQIGSLTVDEENMFNFRPELSLAGRVVFKQQLESEQPAKTIQDVEVLGFNDADFIRYLEVDSADAELNDKFNSFLVDKWLVVELTTTEQPEPVVELLTDNLVDNQGHSLILYGSLPRDVRLSIMEAIKNGGYQVDFDNVRQHRQDGRLLYEYDLVVDLAHFDQALFSYLETYGQSELADQIRLTLALSGQTSRIELTLQIDARARRIVKITNEYGAEEYLTAQGVNQTLDRPEPELSTRQLETIIGN